MKKLMPRRASSLRPAFRGNKFLVTMTWPPQHGEDEESVGDKQTLMCSRLTGVLVSREWFAMVPVSGMLTVGTWESFREDGIRKLMRQGHSTYLGRVEARGGPYLSLNLGKGTKGRAVGT